MSTIKIKDKQFVPFISEIAIEEKLSEPFKVGEEVYVKRRFLQTYNQDDHEKRCVISF